MDNTLSSFEINESIWLSDIQIISDCGLNLKLVTEKLSNDYEQLNYLGSSDRLKNVLVQD